MQFLPFRNGKIAYERLGQGPTLLFLHNGGTSHHIWQGVMERLCDSFDVIGIDLLGYGESSKPGSNYDMATYVASVKQVLDTLGVDKVCLVGNCMGSAISLHFAATYPERVQGLVLVNPLTEQTFKGGWLAWVLKLRQASPKTVGWMYDQLGKLRLPRVFATPSLAFQLGPRGVSKGLHHDTELARHFASRGQLHSLLSVLADIRAYAEVDQFKVAEHKGFPPIATVWGRKNRVLSAKAGEALDQCLRPVESKALGDCGHLAMMEAPDEVAAFIRDFHSRYVRKQA